MNIDVEKEEKFIKETSEKLDKILLYDTVSNSVYTSSVTLLKSFDEFLKSVHK